MKKVVFALLFSVGLVVGIHAQRPGCAIAGIKLDCPSNYFKEVKTTDPKTRIFRYSEKENRLYLFYSVPEGVFDPARIGQLVLGTYPNSKGEQFAWKTLDNPLVMDTRTNYKYDFSSSIGLSDRFLFEVKSFAFDVEGKKLVLGYVTDYSEDTATNKQMFEKQIGFGDNAPGCNAVVTALNSVTKEFKEKAQYCSLTVFSAPK